MTQLAIGDKAPAFTLPADGGRIIKSADYKGKAYLLYFYPKDNTPGCTNEAIDFSTLKPEFDALNIDILGVSADSVKRHDNFKAKHNLSVTLLSDEAHKLCDAYGIWVEKKLYGRSFMGIERASFLINKQGKIAHIWRKVKVKGHANAVLEDARTLG